MKLQIYRKEINKLSFKNTGKKFNFKTSSYYENNGNSYMVKFEKWPCKSNDGKFIYRFKRYGSSNTYLYLLLNWFEHIQFEILQKTIIKNICKNFFNFVKISKVI